MSTADRDAGSESLPRTCDILGPARGHSRDHSRPDRQQPSVLPLGPAASSYECCGDTGQWGRGDLVRYTPVVFPPPGKQRGALSRGRLSATRLARLVSKEAYVFDLDTSFPNL